MPRMTIQFPDEVDTILRQLAKKKQTTKVDILRRALSLYDYVEKEVCEDRRLVIADEEKETLKEIIFQ